MHLNTISPKKGAKHSSKRLGRGIGSGLGKTCGRGHKGQKSRSGGGVSRGFEGGQMPLYRRLPKFGFRSSSKTVFTDEIRLSDLKYLEEEKIIDINSLKMAKLIRKKALYGKIIYSGNINRAVTIRGLQVSNGARIAIENAGGKIEDACK